VKRQLNVVLVLLLSAFILAACETPKANSIPATVDLSSVRQFMVDQVESGQVPSAIALVSKNGKIVFQEAVGHQSPEVAATQDTIVRLDSLTKPITATAIMILVDEGAMRLDDPVATYLPAFADIKLGLGKTATKSITIRHLLTHTAGLAGYSPEVDALWGSSTNVEFADGIARLPLRHNPGDGFQYGNAYEVLPAVVNVVSGKEFGEFVSERILIPLGMNDSFFLVPEEKRNRFSSLYTKDKNDRFTVMSAPNDPNAVAFSSGGGGLKSTVGDYHKFADMLLNGGKTAGLRILSEQSVKAMTEVQVSPEVPGTWKKGRGWGYGLATRFLPGTDNPEPIGTFGWDGGLGTLFFIDPAQDLIGIVFTQIHYSNPHELREGFQQRIHRAFVSK